MTRGAVYPLAMRRKRAIASTRVVVAALALAALAAAGAVRAAGRLEDDLGRSEVRVRSEAYPIVSGLSVPDSGLVERLETLGYRRVHERPSRPGEYFWGDTVLWVFRRAHRLGGTDYGAALLGLRLDRGVVTGLVDARGGEHRLDRRGLVWLEPETLSESLEGDRADRLPVRLDDLPERVWRPLLAAEDHRFFEHGALDARAVARAALANLKRGGVAQGGSTITQQLVKNRDLTPKRTLGRKLSEAARALALEAEYDKREILEAYLSSVYLGHVDGLAIYGYGTAARVYFSRRPRDLTLPQAALLAAMVQGPNGLSPLRHPERALSRRNWVLGRMRELGWVDAGEAEAARASGLGLSPSPPLRSAPVHALSRVAAEARRAAPGRIAEGRGVVVETTLDPVLQRDAEQAVSRGLARLQREHRALRTAPLSAALVAIDPDDGAVLAYVGGDPTEPAGGFDRASEAKRQPGSTVKPLVLLEAFDRCGGRDPLSPSSRVADEPLRWELPSGVWEPENYDRRFEGVIPVRQALAESRNVPFARIERWCGVEATAKTLERAGLAVPDPPPPSLALGTVETSPLELAGAYTVLATPGRARAPRLVDRIELPEGRAIEVAHPSSRRVVRPSSAWLVRDLMTTAVDDGTARVARIEGVDVAAKTGSSSDLKDSWFAGHADGVVAVVWVGLDDGRSLGLTGAAGAGPIWREFMLAAVPARPPRTLDRPRDIVERYVDSTTGLLVRERHRHAVLERFRRGALPPRDRFWRRDTPLSVVK